MAVADDGVLQQGPTGYAGSGQTQVLQQLKIIAIILRQGFGLPDEDMSLLGQIPQTVKTQDPTQQS